MRAPGGPHEDPTGGFSHGGWSFGYWDEAMQASQAEGTEPSELVLGRRTYEIFAAFWPYQTHNPLAASLNEATKHVASRTLSGELSWQHSRLIEGDVVAWIFPLVLGTGKRLFGAGAVPDGLELTHSQTSSTGVIMTSYRAGAEIREGSFVPDEVSESEHAGRAALEGVGG